MQNRRFIESFNAAVEGFIYVLKTERNMRVHFLAALLFMLLGVYLNFSASELIALVLTITLVLTSEMMNTAIELTVDIIEEKFHPMVRVIKDICAGAVLVSSISAVIVGYILFSKRMPFTLETGMLKVRNSTWHITFIAIILVLGLSVIGKLIFHRGTPLRGGMPSGHAAVAFSIWTVIAFITNNSIVITLSFVMAFLIARHRIRDAIHTFWEVVAGGILGVLVTTLVFQLLH